MEWSTVFLSTALSAVVGTLVSLAAVAQTTTRQRRAERRDAARQQMRNLLADFRMKVRKYQASMLASLKRESPGITGDDYMLASAILRVAEDLSLPRRWLVRRRSERLFGTVIFRTADIAPSTEGDTSLGVIAPLLMTQYDPTKIRLQPERARLGLIDEALRTDPGSVELHRLERELRRLAACR